MSMDIDATPDLLLLIQQKLHSVQYRYGSLPKWICHRSDQPQNTDVSAHLAGRLIGPSGQTCYTISTIRGSNYTAESRSPRV